jgi:hypothetical protein
MPIVVMQAEGQGDGGSCAEEVIMALSDCVNRCVRVGMNKGVMLEQRVRSALKEALEGALGDALGGAVRDVLGDALAQVLEEALRESLVDALLQTLGSILR